MQRQLNKITINTAIKWKSWVYEWYAIKVFAEVVIIGGKQKKVILIMKVAFKLNHNSPPIIIDKAISAMQ